MQVERVERKGRACRRGLHLSWRSSSIAYRLAGPCHSFSCGCDSRLRGRTDDSTTVSACNGRGRLDGFSRFCISRMRPFHPLRPAVSPQPGERPRRERRAAADMETGLLYPPQAYPIRALLLGGLPRRSEYRTSPCPAPYCGDLTSRNANFVMLAARMLFAQIELAQLLQHAF